MFIACVFYALFTKDTVFVIMYYFCMFEIIGHRGAGVPTPENTIESFAKAYELGCSRVELDVHLTKDLQPVIIHDTIFDKKNEKYVHHFTWQELTTYNSETGKKIPRLSDCFSAFSNTKLHFQVELKGAETEKIVPALVAEFGLTARTRYTSFVHMRVKKALQYHRAAGGLLMCAVPINPVELLDQANADSFHLSWHHIDKRLVKHLHSKGKKLIAWNAVNKEAVFRILLDMGVDGATTDTPKQFLNYLEKYNTGLLNQQRSEV